MCADGYVTSTSTFIVGGGGGVGGHGLVVLLLTLFCLRLTLEGRRGGKKSEGG